MKTASARPAKGAGAVFVWQCVAPGVATFELLRPSVGKIGSLQPDSLPLGLTSCPCPCAGHRTSCRPSSPCSCSSRTCPCRTVSATVEPWALRAIPTFALWRLALRTYLRNWPADQPPHMADAGDRPNNRATAADANSRRMKIPPMDRASIGLLGKVRQSRLGQIAGRQSCALPRAPAARTAPDNATP